MVKELIIILGATIITVGCKKNTTVTIDEIDCTTVTFSGEIESLFNSKCLACHGVGSTNGTMTNYDEIKVYVDNGQINSRVLITQNMPQGGALTSKQLGQIKCWLDDGAPNN